MKVILTGHTRGLGAAIAENLLARNIAVLGLSRKKNPLLAERYPAALQEVELDLADSAAVASWLGGDSLSRFLSGADAVLLINNAGTVQPVGPVDGQDVSAIARAVALNVTAPLMLASALASASPAARDRRIAHISSGAGRNPFPGWSVYCATKAALDHHARAVTLDQTPGLKICSIAPGVVDTDMQTEIRASTLAQFPLRERFETMKRDGQLATPETIAQGLVDYFLSEEFGKLAIADIRELTQ